MNTQKLFSTIQNELINNNNIIYKNSESGAVLQKCNTLSPLLLRFFSVTCYITSNREKEGFKFKRVLQICNTITEYFDLSLIQRKIVFVLVKLHFSWLRQLTEILGINPAETSRALKNLKARGVIEKAKNEEAIIKGSLRSTSKERLGTSNIRKTIVFKLRDPAPQIYTEIEDELKVFVSEKQVSKINHVKKVYEQNVQARLECERKKNQKHCYECLKLKDKSEGQIEDEWYYKDLLVSNPVWVCKKCKKNEERTGGKAK